MIKPDDFDMGVNYFMVESRHVTSDEKHVSLAPDLSFVMDEQRSSDEKFIDESSGRTLDRYEQNGADDLEPKVSFGELVFSDAESAECLHFNPPEEPDRVIGQSSAEIEQKRFQTTTRTIGPEILI